MQLELRISLFITPTFDVMSPRHCDKKEMKLISLWAVDIHDLFGLLFETAMIHLITTTLAVVGLTVNLGFNSIASHHAIFIFLRM